jgi:DNA-damage-inducible protein J
MADSLIQVRVNSELKKHADEVLLAMGLRVPEAIRMFLQQTINDQALPFQPHVSRLPNKATVAAFDEVKKGKYIDSNLTTFKKTLKSKK